MITEVLNLTVSFAQEVSVSTAIVQEVALTVQFDLEEIEEE